MECELNRPLYFLREVFIFFIFVFTSEITLICKQWIVQCRFSLYRCVMRINFEPLDIRAVLAIYDIRNFRLRAGARARDLLLRRKISRFGRSERGPRAYRP